MKYSTKLSDAMHILTFIALNSGKDLSSTKIAESVKTNPSFVRQIMMKLKKADLIATTKGQARPTLTRNPDEITLCDVYRAVEGDKPLLHLDTHTNPECGIGVNIQYALKDFYDQIQDTAESEMKRITLQNLIDSFYEKAELPKGSTLEEIDL